MKIIDPIINPNIHLADNKIFFSDSFRSRKTISAAEETEALIEFTIEKPDPYILSGSRKFVTLHSRLL